MDAVVRVRIARAALETAVSDLKRKSISLGLRCCSRGCGCDEEGRDGEREERKLHCGSAIASGESFRLSWIYRADRFSVVGL